MSVPTLDQRIAWSLAIRPHVPPVLGDHAMWVQFRRYHVGAQAVAPAGVVTHPSVVEPDYRAPDRNRGDSLAKLALTGWYRRGFTVDQLADIGDPAAAGAVVGRGAAMRLESLVTDALGDRWRLSAIGSGMHHRDCPQASRVTVTRADGSTEVLVSRPVSFRTYREWWSIIAAMAPAPIGPPVVPSLWNAARTLSNLTAGRPFKGHTPQGREIIGATRSPGSTVTRPKTARPVADVAAEAAAILHQWSKMGIPPRKRGGQSRGQTAARKVAETLPLVGIVGPTVADLPPDIATALRAALDPAPATT